MADTKKKYDALNIVRALAAIAILVYHYTTRYNDIYGHASTWKINFPHGYFAVSTFFILSGFLTVINLRQNETAYRFLQRRAVRLYPTYWICMLVTTAFCLVLLPEKLIGIKNYLIGLTMLQSAVSVPSVDGAYWTLLHELRFYVFVAVIVLFKWKKFGIKIAALWQALSLFTFIFGLHNESVIIKLLKVATGYEYAHLFCIGVAFVAIARNKKAVLPHIMLLVALFTHIAMYSISYTVFLLCIYAVLYLCIYGVIPDKLNYKGKKFVEFIAGISYPLYLLHQFIGYGILKWIESNVSTSEIIIFVPMAVSIALAWLVSKIDAVGKIKKHTVIG